MSWMLRSQRVLLHVLCLTAWAQLAGAEDVTVDARGQGLSRDVAVKCALRNALEEAAGAFVASRTHVVDFALVRDVVFARASGIVKGFEVLNETSTGTIVQVEVRATVSKESVALAWANAEALIKERGRPSIMVVCVDRINRHIERDSPSRVGSAIEKRLREYGFRVIDPVQKEMVNRKKAEDAALSDNWLPTLRELAKTYKADIYLRGTADAAGPERRDVAGIPVFLWDGHASVQAVWTESAETIFSLSHPVHRAGARSGDTSGAVQCLDEMGANLGESSVFELLEAWSRGDVGDIIVEVSGVTKLEQAAEIYDKLTALPGVDHVEREFAAPTARFVVQTTLPTQHVADQLSGAKFSGYTLEVLEQRKKTIACRLSSRLGP